MLPQSTTPDPYTSASQPMLTALKAMKPAIKFLIDTTVDPKQREALGVIKHNALELQCILCQIDDVEKSRSGA